MAGLLDGWGDFIKTPEGQGLLSAVFGGLAGARKGQPINSIGRAGLAGLSGYSGAEDRIAQMADSKVKRGYMQSQIDENASQNATRAQALKRQQEQDAYFMGTPGAGLLADAPTSPGAYKPSIDGMGPVAPMPATGTAPSMGKFDEWSAQFGIPKDALLADYRANGGKGIADMLYKRGAPDMTVSNGYIFDKNKQGAGFLPSLSTSQSGQTSMTRIGPDGLPVVSAPEGAVNTFGAYKSVESGLKPIKVYNPQTGREEYRTEAQVVGATAPSAASPRPIAPRQGDSDQKAIFGQELTAAQGRLAAATTPEEKTRAQSDVDGLGREMSRLGLSASGNFAAGPSATEAARSAADKTQFEAQAKDVAETRKTIMNAGFNAPSMISKYQQLGKLLEGVDGGTLTATGTNLASTANSLGLKIDKNLPNKEAAAALGNAMALELRSPANGAGMPGALSDSDRNFLASMVPNASQSAQGRKQLIEAQIAVNQRNQDVAQFARNYEKKHGKLDNGFFDQMQAYSAANPLFGGK